MTDGFVPALDQPLAELARRYRTGDADPREVVGESLRRIGERGAALGAVTDVLEGAEEVAAERAAELARGIDRGPLHGVPVVVKELIDVEGLPRSAATHVHPPGWGRAVADAGVVARLRDAGAVVVARGRTHEFAWGITTRHPDGTGTLNPLDPELIAGGSSGGVAALVAAGCAPVGIGTDTGGSVRIPATFCGLVGWKPALDRLPIDGVVPLAPSFDTVGLLVRSVEDARAVDRAVPTGLGAEGAVAPVTALLEDHTLPTCDAATRAALEDAAGQLGARRGLVAGDGPADWPPAGAVVAGYDVLQRAFALVVHRDELRTWPAQSSRYGRDVAERLREAEALTSAEIEGA
ncbi:MAG: amidase, partial [Actinomycetota bacterium]